MRTHGSAPGRGGGVPGRGGGMPGQGGAVTRRTALSLLFLALGLALPVTLPTFWVTLATNIGIFAIVALGLVLLTGVAGLTSFGQAAFMGAGAYTTAVLTSVYGWNPWLTLLAGFAVTSLVALTLGAVTLRMQGHYLPLATIAWGISLYYVFGNWALTGGFTGLRDIPALSVFGLKLADTRAYAYLVLAALVLCALAAQNLLSSRIGRALRALRSGSVVAESFGVNTFALRVQIFVLAALLASLAGWLYAHQLRFVNPTPFGLSAGIEFLFMAVLGGSGVVWGALSGAAVITLLREWLQNLLPRLLGQTGSFETVVFGLMVILALHFARRGLWPLLERLVPPDPPRLLGHPAPFCVQARPASGEPLLVVEGVVKQFGGLKAVNDVSFELHSGEILGLIGPNGAGKSTLFNLISGVSNATCGRVSLRGRDTQHLGARAIHRLGVARTFQHVRLFPELSLLDNAMLGGFDRAKAGMLASLLHLERREEAALQQEALKQLELVGLRDLAFEQAGNLPLGQQRLLEIARALVADPVLLLLDEPAAGLRHAEKQALAVLLRRLRDSGVTVLLVEHDMDLVMKLADRLVVMNYGEKLAEGTPAAVRGNLLVREAYLGGPV